MPLKTRLIRMRFRRRWRKGQRQVEDLGNQAERQIEQNFLGRLKHLKPVRRFVVSWVVLLLVLIGGVAAQTLSLSHYYQTLQPIPGGIYNEGVLGRFTNANPLYATSAADATVSRLVFAGLFTYDGRGNLVGDLASGYRVDARGTTYTVQLKPGLTWQDGRPLTSEDVVFTYQLIQNPDARSPLQNSWQGITIAAPDARTVVFTLSGTLASFPYNMTNGIVPKRLLASVAPADLRAADFNTVRPVGAGPFAWQTVQVEGNGKPQGTRAQIALVPFEGYNGGPPKLQKFVVQVFADQAELVKAFQAKQLTAAEGLTEVPDQLRKDKNVITHNFSQRAATMVFFKTSSGVLAEQPVRQALVRAADVRKIVDQLDYPARPVREPLLMGQLGYDPAYVQPGFDLAAARALLDANGWVAARDGLRAKAGQPLAFSLVVADNAEHRRVAGQLEQQWRQLGVRLDVQIQNAAEFQSTLSSHGYDAILNGIEIGPDPDVFVYWDSTQADVRASNRLNLSEYKNPTADTALEAGRTRLDPLLRTIKYKPFLQAWQQDSPALGLYQPRILYLTNGRVSGLDEHPVTTVTDRLSGVHLWQIREARVTNP